MTLLRWLAMPLVVLPLTLATAASPYDGIYKGQNTAVRGGPPTCNPPGNVTWTVTNAHFIAKWGPTEVPADIGTDGSFNATGRFMAGSTRGLMINVQLTGRVSGGVLEADMEGAACKYHYSLKRS